MVHDGGVEAHVGLVVSLDRGMYFSDNLLFSFLLAFDDLCDGRIKLAAHFIYLIGNASELTRQLSLRTGAGPGGQLSLDFVHCL